MSVATLRERVMALAGKPVTPSVLCITGASGAGKTAVLAALRERIEARVLPTLAFDSLGVPSQDEMHAAWESPRGWQKAMTYHWVYTAKHVYRTHPLVVLEGPFDPQYAIAACAAHRVRSVVVLLHCEDGVRAQRLATRGQAGQATVGQAGQASVGQAGQASVGQAGQASVGRAGQVTAGQHELATAETTSWASYLHEQTQQLGGVVVDAAPALAEVVDSICAHALPLLEPKDDEPRDPKDRVRTRRITRLGN